MSGWIVESFRPLSGNLIFQFKKQLIEIGSRFPSPVGESYFSMRNVQKKKEPELMFPSPVGESYFSIDG